MTRPDFLQEVVAYERSKTFSKLSPPKEVDNDELVEAFEQSQVDSKARVTRCVIQHHSFLVYVFSPHPVSPIPIVFRTGWKLELKLISLTN